MNAVDLVVLFIIGFNGILGLVRGAVWQVLRLLSLILGIWTAAEYGEEFLSYFPASWNISDEVGIHVARIVVFLSVYLLMFGVTNLVQAVVKKIKLGGLDRSLGALLGMAKGALYCSLVLYLQFWPFVGEIDAVKTQLSGSPDGSTPASRANEIFLQHVRDRVNAMVPEDDIERLKRMTEDAEKARKLLDQDDK